MSGCDPIGYRWLLVFTNAAFLVPAAYVLARYGLDAVVESVCALLLVVFSGLHHWCSEADICGSECVLGFHTTYALDFVFSNMAIPVVLGFGIPHKRWPWKAALYGSYALVVTLLFEVGEIRDFLTYVLLAVGAACIVLPARLIVRYREGTLQHFYDQHIQRRALVAAVVTLGLAALFRVLADTSTLNYAIAHSLWHFFAAAALFFGLNVYDPQALYAWTRIQDNLGSADDGKAAPGGTSGFALYAP